MSRRPPNPAAERAAQNTQTIKSLLKLEGNKTCADCKRNKHPRWASWNLGIFVCIRCSGIHRGMGTHISRVKSVDLDAWTDEQLQSVLKWGNARANKYWEAKLALGHVPSEAKIENFIRTKYESKRWVMEGPIPDPATLDVEGDDDIPLNLVKEKHNIERSASQKASSSQGSAPSQVRRAVQKDLFADDDEPPPRANSAAPSTSRLPSKVDPAPPKQTKPADSLLGLDFFGSEAPPPNRPSSAAANPGTQSRPDLKQSILSLYASAPRPQPQQQPSHASSGSFGGMQSPPAPQQQQSQFGGMNDAFSNLSFAKSTSPVQTQPKASPFSSTEISSSFGGTNDAFSNLSFAKSTSPIQAQPKASPFSSLGISSSRPAPSQITSPASNLSGGSFFEAKPVPKPAPPAPQPSRGFSSSSGFGAFDSAPGMSPTTVSNNTASSGLGDLFDFSSPTPQSPPSKQPIASPTTQHSSVFNLSQPAPQPKAQPQPAPVSSWSNNNDAWGSNDAWSTAKVSPPLSKPAPPQAPTSFGWESGNSLASQSIVPGGTGGFTSSSHGPPPKVAADEDFGGWSSAAPVSPGAVRAPTKPATGFATSDDLFSNVWE